MRFDTYPYDAVSSFYDELAAFYSRGRIAQTKRFQLDAIAAGDRVLYAGVGRGDDALAAARRGARVTAIDLSPRMLARLEAGLQRDGLSAELVCGDVAEEVREASFDVVAANYFLNLFEAQRAGALLSRLCRLVAPEGVLLLADFAPSAGGALGRVATELYYRPVNWIAWAFGFCALHPIFDYGRLLEGTGFGIESQQRFPVFRGRDPAFVALRARRLAPAAASGGASGDG